VDPAAGQAEALPARLAERPGGGWTAAGITDRQSRALGAATLIVNYTGCGGLFENHPTAVNKAAQAAAKGGGE
jgi:hypothetical protein